MALQDFKVSSLNFGVDGMNLQNNISGEWSDVAIYTVPHNRVIVPFDGRIMYLKPTGKTTVNQDPGSSTTVSLGHNIEETPGENVGDMAQVYVDDGGWTEAEVSSIDYAANEVTYNVGALSTGSGLDHIVYAQLAEGQFRFVVDKPSGANTRRASLSTFSMRKLLQRNHQKIDTAPRLRRTLPVISKARLIISANVSATVAWEIDDANHPNDIAQLDLPTAFGRMDQVGSQLESQFKQIFSGV